ncbi:hypothetical protein COOONC_15105 [Cooperia oncophora]
MVAKELDVAENQTRALFVFFECARKRSWNGHGSRMFWSCGSQSRNSSSSSITGTRDYLKDLLEVHSVDYIMNRLKEDFPLETSRLHHVTREELRTIQRKHRLTPVPAENDCGDLWMEDEKKHNPSGQDVTADGNEPDIGGESATDEKCEDVKDFQDLMSAMECEPGIAVENDPSTSQGDDKDEIFNGISELPSVSARPSTQEVSDAPPKSDVSECESPLSPERRFDMSSSSSTAHSPETPLQTQKKQENEKRLRCFLCSRMMLRRNLYAHLQRSHSFSKEDINRVKVDIRLEGHKATNRRERARISCPLCGEIIFDQVGFVRHCEHLSTGDILKASMGRHTPTTPKLDAQTFIQLWCTVFQENRYLSPYYSQHKIRRVSCRQMSTDLLGYAMIGFVGYTEPGLRSDGINSYPQVNEN